MSYRLRRGLGAVSNLPVDIWGFVPAPDDTCPWTHVMGAQSSIGGCLTPADMGFNPAGAAATEIGRMPITPKADPAPGDRVMDVWRSGPWQRYTSGTPAVFDLAQDKYITAAQAAAKAAAPAASAPAASAPAASSQAGRQVVVSSSNGAAGATGGAALPSGGAQLASSVSSVVDTAKGLPMWVWVAAAAGVAVLFAQGGGRGR
jgi:hypothetical protein